jgi:hypothetical protein
MSKAMVVNRRIACAAAVCVLLTLFGAPSLASAMTRAPGFRVSVIPLPTNFSASEDKSCITDYRVQGFEAGSCDMYKLTIANSGSVPTDGSPITIKDFLPNGITAEEVAGKAENIQQPSVECSHELVKCTFNGVLGPDEVLIVNLWVHIGPTVSGTVTNSVIVSGGGVALPTVASFQNTLSASGAAPGLSSFEIQATGLDGAPDNQAGDHPYESTATLAFGARLRPNIIPTQGGDNAGTEYYVPLQYVKDVVVKLPAGLVGNTQEAAQCTQTQLDTNKLNGVTNCPPNSMVGTIQLDTSGQIRGSAGKGVDAVSPVFNIVPEHGYPAEFGFTLLGKAQMLYATVVPSAAGGGYAVRVNTPGITKLVGLVAIAFTFWGVPSEASHTDMRGVESGIPPVAFLTNPVDCSAGSLTATAFSDTWEDPGRVNSDGSPDLSDPAWRSVSTSAYPQISGCNLLQFAPGIEVSQETSQADEPSGTTVELRVPQAPQLPGLTATPEPKNITVALPSGVSVSPSAGDGLQACTSVQFALSSAVRSTCPNGSVLGTVQITTPLLPTLIEGQVFLAAPGCNPCTNADAADGNMFKLYLEAEGAGVIIKREGTIYANTATGQLTTTFANNPQVPFSDLLLRFKGGVRASLATPQSCGTFVTTTDMTPWSAPVTPDATPSSAFDVSWDGKGGACPAVAPLAPSFSAGTSNPNAGQFSPLTLTFFRQDREQDLAAIQVRTPPGLLGVVAGVPLCGEPQADLGTCSQASRIGTMTVAAGPGAHPFYTKGSLYLTGPYKGAPLGLSIVVPTVAGPFDLGNVVVRAQIEVDPHTAALTVTSDPLPQILDGIPLRLRTANVTVDRPNFTFNPTNCAQLRIEGTITGAQGAVYHASAPFAVAGCHGLSFGPQFKVYTSGHTSRVNGASLDAKLVFPSGPQSNISHVKVELPKQLPARLTTLQKACPDRVFNSNPANCPLASLVGVARAITPVLPVPLTGPAYFVSHGGEAFPNLIVVLQGYGVRIDLVGDTFINKAGVTSSTFTNVPDVQVTSFELYLPQGPHSALAANGNLCKQKLKLPARFEAQDGAVLKQDTPIKVTGCPKAVRARNAKRASKARRARGARTASNRHSGHGRRER